MRGEASVSAERGYLRETGNLVFHTALVGVLVAVGIGGGFGFTGQRVIVEGQTFVNTLAAYDSFNPGRFFDDTTLEPYRPLARRASTRSTRRRTPTRSASRSTSPRTSRCEGQGDDARDADASRSTSRSTSHGTDVYLLGNGYAPTITVREPDGEVVFTDSVPFLPQDANLTSIGVVKVPDGLRRAARHGRASSTRRRRSSPRAPTPRATPTSILPVLTLNVYEGDLGIDGGDADLGVHARPLGHGAAHRRRHRRRLDRAEAGRDAPSCRTGSAPSRSSTPNPDAGEGDYAQSVPRFASFDIHHDPTQGWVLVFAVLILGGLLVSLFVPRRRMWVKAADAPRRQRRARVRRPRPRRGSRPRGRRDGVRRQARGHVDGCRGRGARVRKPTRGESVRRPPESTST